MGRKSKYSIEEKVQAVLDYKNGIRGKTQICNDLGLNPTDPTFYKWIDIYEKYGELGFLNKDKNQTYTNNANIKITKNVNYKFTKNGK